MEAVGGFLHPRRMGFHEFLSINAETWDLASEQLSGAVLGRLHSDIQRLEARGVTRMYFNDDWKDRVALKEDKVNEYENVWLPMRQFLALKGDVTALQIVWRDNRENWEANHGAHLLSLFDRN